MENIKSFTQTMPFIISFLITTLLINMSFGNKVSNQFLMLILFSMVILNSDKFTKFIGGISGE